MPSLLSSLVTRLNPVDVLAQRASWRLVPFVGCQLAALVILVWSEDGLVAMLAFALAWGLLNFVLLALVGRPALAAAATLILLIGLIVVSRFKFKILWMTASFIDVMIIDSDTFAFLVMVFPQIRMAVILALVAVVPAAVLLWRFDPLRVRRRTAFLGAAMCLIGLSSLSLAVPVMPGEAFGDDNYLSTFARSAVESVVAYAEQGFLQADRVTLDHLQSGAEGACRAVGRPPHIILLHDESSFDIRAIEGVKVPPNYGGHFVSFDGKRRKFLVEGAGGPSWFTEYNVLAGLSSRSFGRFQFFVTRIAAGRVQRGLPRTLAHCGYSTSSLFPVYGGFLGAASFHKGTGIETFVDGHDVGAHVFEPDQFYYGHAMKMIADTHARGPMFLYLYLTANHFTWDYPLREELTPAGWQNPGNPKYEVNEYLRRQAMSERDYKDFRARLEREFPGEPFLIVRYGDHQPDFAKLLIDPSIDAWELGNRLLSYDPRYFTTYYAIDTINFTPADVSSALDVLDGPYLPLVILEAAGIPLDPSFAEQKKIMQRCAGLFYGCDDGAQARRFNRMLIDAGLIRGL